MTKAGPLEFRKWWPGAPMTPGVYDIPVPDGTELVVPDAAIVPMNGFDEQGYRLGYGGGYFDRTLAACTPRPLAIGVSFELARLPTIHPQPHDIAMDFIVTEFGVRAVEAGSLVALPADDAAAQVRALAAQRGW
jgi:5,10-methenyltetrahydrofolate synthetase